MSEEVKPKGCEKCKFLVFSGLMSRPWICLRTDLPPEPEKCELARR